MLNYTTLELFIQISRMIIDILIMSLLIYYCLKLVRNNSRTIQIFKGIILVVVINSLAKFLGLSTVAWAANAFVNWGFIAVIIIFQPEIRSILEKLGKTSVFNRLSTLSGNEKERLVEEVVKATMSLSEEKTGALISIEQSQSMIDYVQTGTVMNSRVTAELLTAIFVTTTPLHDGAVIIQGDKLACASAYFPPTALELPPKYGARHRAALGISEINDSITIVVSEETGTVSIAQEGKLTVMDEDSLREFLMKVICYEEIEISKSQSISKKENNERTLKIEEEIKSELSQRQTTSEPAKDKISILNMFARKKEDTKEVESVEETDNESQIKEIQIGTKKKIKVKKVREESGLEELNENSLYIPNEEVNSDNGGEQ